MLLHHDFDFNDESFEMGFGEDHSLPSPSPTLTSLDRDEISFIEHVGHLEPSEPPSVSLPPKIEPQQGAYDVKEIDAQLRSLSQQKKQLEKELECVTQLLELNQKRKLRQLTNSGDLPNPPKKRKIENETYLTKDENGYFRGTINSPFEKMAILTQKIEPDDQPYIPPYSNLQLNFQTASYSLPAHLKPLNTGGKRNGMIIRCRLYCAHCEEYFYAKPTARKAFFVLNHQCCGDKRKQYVIGKHHRKCRHNHAPTPCIQFAPKH